jgi:hypothetical protein
MRRAASRLLSYFLVRLSLLVTSTAVLPAPYYQIPPFSGDTLTTGPGYTHGPCRGRWLALSLNT